MAKAITRAESALISDNLTTTSLIVAEKFGKQHRDVMRKIEALDIPDAYRLRNFTQTVIERPNPSGGAPIRSRAYNLTRDGFALLVMGFTGKRAMEWKITFLDAFNRMQVALADQRPARKRLTAKPATAATAAPLAGETITWALTRPVAADLRIVLAELARRASPGVTCEVALQTLSMALGLQHRTVTRRLEVLATHGLIAHTPAHARTDPACFTLLMPHAPHGPAPDFPALLPTAPRAPDDRPVTWRQLRLVLHDAAMGLPPDPSLERLFTLFARYQGANWSNTK